MPFFLASLVLLLATGCSKKDPTLPETAPVTGTVKYKGKQLTEGTVMFYPQGLEKSKPGIGQISPEGTFTLTTYDKDDGAAIGTNRVTVQVFPSGGNPGEESKGSSIPKKYGDQNSTDLKVEVKAEKNVFHLELKD